MYFYHGNTTISNSQNKFNKEQEKFAFVACCWVPAQLPDQNYPHIRSPDDVLFFVGRPGLNNIIVTPYAVAQSLFQARQFRFLFAHPGFAANVCLFCRYNAIQFANVSTGIGSLRAVSVAPNPPLTAMFTSCRFNSCA